MRDADALFRGAKLPDGTLSTIVVKDGKIRAIGPSLVQGD